MMKSAALMKSVALAITDAAVVRSAADITIGELRDQRHPLALRIHKNRTKGTWYLVRYEAGKKVRQRLGYWPALKAKDAQTMIADALIKIGKGEFLAADQFTKVGQLLAWYKERCLAETFKACSRKKALCSHIDKHLAPKLGHLPISQVNKQTIDEMFFLPAQANGLKASTIKHMFYTLKPAFKRAASLGYISFNPMSDIVFGQHITKRIKPKECALLISDKDELINSIASASPVRQMFILFMLLFGTRIGETRNLLWDHLQLDERRIVIPAELTKTEESHVLPITDAVYELICKYQAKYKKPDSKYMFENGLVQLTESQSQSWVRSVSKGKWSAHDLRKLARSSWAELGIDYWVGERLLNHKPKGLDAVYIRAGAFDVKLAALSKYHNWLFNSRHYTGFDNI